MATAHQLRWNNYPQHVLTALEKLQVNDELTDVTLSSEGKRIKAHKVLLSACSEFFKETFKENPSKHPVVILKGVSFSDLQAVIQYIYNGHVNVTQERLPSFLQTTEILEIKASQIQIQTITDAYRCAQCSANRAESKITTDTGAQTEECTAVEFGLQDNIPRIFYTALLSDNNLQHKIAQTINEHIQDPKKGEQQGDVLQKISSKAETEIDKFLVELLRDLPDDSDAGMPSDIGLNLGPTTSADAGGHLSSMFRDADMSMLFGESSSSNVPCSGMAEVGQEKVSTVKNQSSSMNVQTTCTTPLPDSAVSGNATIEVTVSELSNTAKTPNRPHGQSSVKRITPTPVSMPSHAAPAVFNSSVVIEKKKIEFGDKSAKCTIKTANIEPPTWQKLNRKSIAPKIPHPVSQTVSSNTRVIKRASETLLPLGPELFHSKKTDEIRLIADSSVPVNPSIISPPMPPVITRLKDQNNPPSVSKRKATPVKLTPEKAKNMTYNFMHVNVSNDIHQGSLNKSSEPRTYVNSNVDSTVKETPSIPPLVLLAPDGTPMQQVLSTADDDALTSSTSALETISPNALQRLIFSANKIGYSTAPAPTFLNKKKSFSTPRKRKHVRNLTFATPPSFKGATPGFEQYQSLEARTAQKRKATDDSFSAEIRSKKRLNWPASEKKSRNELSENASCPTTNEKQEVVMSVPYTVPCPADNSSVQLASKPVAVEKPQVIQNQHPPRSMPTILEESPSSRKKQRKSSKKPELTVSAPELFCTSNDDVVEPGNLQNVVPPTSSTTAHTNTDSTDNTNDQVHLPVLPQNPLATEKPTIAEVETRSMPTIASTSHGLGRSKKENKSSKKPKVTLSGKGLFIKPKDNLADKKTDDKLQEVLQSAVPTTEQTTAGNSQILLPLRSKPLTDDKSQSNTNQSKSLPTILEESRASAGIAEEVSRPSKKERRLRKHKPTATEIELFGESPVKPKRSSKKEKEVKLPVDVVAAQAVAFQAVPLGNPCRSARFLPVKTKSSEALHREPGQVPSNENAVPFPSDSAENQASSGQVPPHGRTTSPECIPFNIVPAPLGFPEPTPIKSFAELGYMNLSNTGFNSPLITPLKTVPPLGLNETHFTLPPTPRIIEDPDSNSNSTHSLRLIYDGGLYPVNLLTSTPLKFGVPRTPGKESSSSNSRSPPELGKPGVCQQVNQSSVPFPLPGDQHILEKVVDVAESVSPPPISKPVKSDGELSSSDEDESSNSNSSTPTNNCGPTPTRPQDTEPTCPPPAPTISKPPVLVSSSNIPRSIQPPFPPNTQLNTPLPVDPCMKRLPDIEFQVGGRGKKLTISEKETLLTLLEIGSQPPAVNIRKPVATDLLKPAATPKVPPIPEKSTANDGSKEPYKLLQNKNLAQLINLVKRKSQQGSPVTPPPKK